MAPWIIGGLLAVAAWGATEPQVAQPLRKAVKSWVGANTPDWGPFTAEVRFRVVKNTIATESGGQPWAVNPNNERHRDPPGPGVSWGILQWTQGSGNLGKVLDACRAADRATFDSIVAPFSPTELIRVCSDGGSVSRTVNGKLLWDPAWVQKLQALGRVPLFGEVQLWFAANGSHMKAAADVCTLLYLESERGLALAFDRATQQGEGWAVGTAKKIAANWKSTGQFPEYAGRLKAFAEAARARASTSPWKSIVNERIDAVLARNTLSDSSLKAA